MHFFSKISLLSFFFISALFVPSLTLAENQEVLDIFFPVEGTVTFFNDFHSARGSNIHAATDIMAPKMNRIFAAQDGVITFMPLEEPAWGFGIFMLGDDGYKYNYIHINNDTPGTDDGNGGPQHAYAPGIERGSRVKKGQHIAWVGDSGNAEHVGSHLHFEIEAPNGEPVNPYFSLIKAQAAQTEQTWNYNPDVERELAPTINAALNLKKSGQKTPCTSGSLIKIEKFDAVYYCGANGKRYAFPNAKVYFSWYKDFSDVETIEGTVLGDIPLGGMVPYRPGTQLVKSTISPRVYAVAGKAVLRQIPSPYVAESIFGKDWAKKIHDLHDVFLSSYKIGEVIE